MKLATSVCKTINLFQSSQLMFEPYIANGLCTAGDNTTTHLQQTSDIGWYLRSVGKLYHAPILLSCFDTIKQSLLQQQGMSIDVIVQDLAALGQVNLENLDSSNTHIVPAERAAMYHAVAQTALQRANELCGYIHRHDLARLITVKPPINGNDIIKLFPRLIRNRIKDVLETEIRYMATHPAATKQDIEEHLLEVYSMDR